jgi:hypothetical protein
VSTLPTLAALGKNSNWGQLKFCSHNQEGTTATCVMVTLDTGMVRHSSRSGSASPGGIAARIQE